VSLLPTGHARPDARLDRVNDTLKFRPNERLNHSNFESGSVSDSTFPNDSSAGALRSGYAAHLLTTDQIEEWRMLRCDCLSLNGLERLESAHQARELAFIVEDELSSCLSSVVEFLSLGVASLYAQDITSQEFSIETEDPDHFFGILLSAGF
jgi:hypothetical protein